MSDKGVTSNCGYLTKEAQCAPFTTAHGPSTRCCDEHITNKCAVFHELYNPKKPFRSCYNNQVGKEYICPTVSPGGLPCGGAYNALGDWFQAQQCAKTGPMTCHHQNPNIGVHELCPYKERYTSLERPNQSGAGKKVRKSKKKNYRSRMVNDKYMQVGGGCTGCGNKACSCNRDYCRQSYGPDYFNLAALGLQGRAYQPQQSPLAGYGKPDGCPYNLKCTCGPNCPCGAECTCGQDDKVCCDKGAAVRAEGEEGEAPEGGCPGVPRDSPYTCHQKQCTTKCGCPAFDSTCRPNKTVSQFVCGNRTRCGNGEVSPVPGCGCDCQEVTPKLWNQPVNPNRQYGLTQPEEVPGYYLDVSQPRIGGRPVRVQSDRETVPSMLLCNKTNLPGRCFGCRQPCWNQKCL